MRLVPVRIDPAAALAALLLAAAGSSLAAQRGGSAIGKVIDVDTAMTYGIAEPASGRFLVYANSRGIHVYNPKTGKVTATIDRRTAPIQSSYFGGLLSVSASGRRLVFIAAGETSGSGHVWSADLDSLTGAPVSAPHRVSILGAEVARISDDGRWIAFVTAEPREGAQPMRKLLVMPSDGGDERMLDSAGRIQTPYWTPDGRAIYYIRGRGNGPALARVATAGGRPDSLAAAVAVIGVSPDGRRVAYYPPTNGDRVPLRIADAEGREIGSATVPLSDFYFAWSRHDASKLFSRRNDAPTSFKTVSLDNGKQSSYRLADRYSFRPLFSPNGRQLATLTIVDDRVQLAVFDVASRARRVLGTPVEPDGSLFQWSPDGSRIAFLAQDSSLMRHDLYVVDVATSRSTRLTDFGRASPTNAPLFRWRSDGQSIDFITGAGPHGAPTSIERVTLGGVRSVISRLPSIHHGLGTTGGYRLLDDSLVALGKDYSNNPNDSSFLAIVDIRTGATRTRIPRFAYWFTAGTANVLSPDGKWLAFGTGGQRDNRVLPQWAITSLDGKTVRLLGEAMGCDAWPQAWLPDSRSLIAVGAESCDQWDTRRYVVPIDGGPARRLPIPENVGTTITPDGRSVLAATYDRYSTSIVAVDITKALASGSRNRTPRASGRN